MAPSTPSNDGRKKKTNSRTTFIAPALPLIPNRAAKAQAKVKEAETEVSIEDTTSNTDQFPPSSALSSDTNGNLTNGAADIAKLIAPQTPSPENGVIQADTILVNDLSTEDHKASHPNDQPEYVNLKRVEDPENIIENAKPSATTPRASPSSTTNHTPGEPSQTNSIEQETENALDKSSRMSEVAESRPDRSFTYSESPINTASSQFLRNIPLQQPSPVRDWQVFQHGEEEKIDWAEEMSSETLHLPPMPRLPELHADSSSPTQIRQLVVTNGNGPDHPPRPIFGSGTEEEIFSNGYSRSRSSTETSVDNVTHMKQVITGNSYPGCRFRPPPPAYNTRNDRVATIEDHMNYLYHTRSFSEWVIQVLPSNKWDHANAHRIHGAILSRSRPLQEAMFTRNFNVEYDLILTLHSPRYLDFSAFEYAIRFLYTNELMDFPAHFRGPITDKAMKVRRHNYIMAYLMSGYVLGVQEIANQGIDLMERIADWDIAELIVQGALEMRSYIPGGDQPISRHSTPDQTTYDNKPTSLIEIPGHVRSRKPEPVEILTGSTKESKAILNVLIECISTQKLGFRPGNFRLQTDPSDILPSYLPDVREHSGGLRKLSNPALTSITFGSMPSVALPAPSPTRTPQPVFSSQASNKDTSKDNITNAEEALSAILLNIPFQELEFFFYHFITMFDEEEVLDLFEKVVHEREVKRQRVLFSKLVPDKTRLANRKVWEIVGRKEALRRAGRESKLTSTWIGFENPRKGY